MKFRVVYRLTRTFSSSAPASRDLARCGFIVICAVFGLFPADHAAARAGWDCSSIILRIGRVLPTAMASETICVALDDRFCGFTRNPRLWRTSFSLRGSQSVWKAPASHSSGQSTDSENPWQAIARTPGSARPTRRIASSQEHPGLRASRWKSTAAVPGHTIPAAMAVRSPAISTFHPNSRATACNGDRSSRRDPSVTIMLPDIKVMAGISRLRGQIAPSRSPVLWSRSRAGNRS